MEIILEVEEFNSKSLNFFEKLDIFFKSSKYFEKTQSEELKLKYRKKREDLSSQFNFATLPSKIKKATEETPEINTSLISKSQEYHSYNQYLNIALNKINNI